MVSIEVKYFVTGSTGLGKLLMTGRGRAVSES